MEEEAKVAAGLKALLFALSFGAVAWLLMIVSAAAAWHALGSG